MRPARDGSGGVCPGVLIVAAAAPFLAASGAVLAAPAGAVQELHVEGEITSFVARDMDGDGRKEIWVSYHGGERRFVGLFRARAAAGDAAGEGARRAGAVYPRVPDQVITADPQAVLFALGDYAPEPGLELLLLSSKSGVLYPLDAAAAVPRRLFRTDLFFASPDRDALPDWLSAGKVDIDGDGRDDLVLPEKHRLRLVLQRPAPGEPRGGARESGSGSGGGGAGEGPAPAWGREVVLPIGYYSLTDSREERIGRLVREFLEDAGLDGALLSATYTYPFPLLADFDGDGRLDVIVKQPGYRLEVYRQLEPGVFQERADFLVHIPWAEEATSLEFRDLDGDGKLDMVASTLLLDKLATEVRIFLQRPEETSRGFARPIQALRIAGFFRAPELADANGDGRLDLLTSTYRVDLLEGLKGKVVDEVEITHQVYLAGADTPFERRPGYARAFLLRTSGLQGEERRPHLYAGRDLNGDGRTDVLFIDAQENLRLYRGLPGATPSYEEASAFAEKVAAPRRVHLDDLDGRPGDEILLRFPRRLEIHGEGTP